MARVRVSNVDGEELKVRQARSLSKKLCVMGLFGVPFLWVVHLWYFWPEVHKENPDPYIKRNAVRSMSAFAVVLAALFLWFVVNLNLHIVPSISNVDMETLLGGG
eukprot:CAMPEP_0197492242 /NCGR_PEP_ID=MMETSP1311-20131121/7132_1 /TAXON_ID=464262 /ORGANISM="Genus nov. species nov., Strain RCC856" /LENGTH=104 /DNA_ID=CAMNT_0043037037 /DNA_START=30 /DNA_END=344 /DNA_ORIENTATION=-